MTGVLNFKEKYNSRKILFLYKNQKLLDKICKNKADKTKINDFIFRVIQNDFEINANYKLKNDHYARCYSNGIQMVNKSIRNFLLENENIKDYDLKNSHPSCLLYLAQQNGINCVNLKDYVENNKDFIKNNYNDDKIKCKTDVLVCINGINKVHIDKLKQCLKPIRNEVVNIINFFKEDLNYKLMYENSVETCKDNPDGSFICRLMAKVEFDVIDTFINYKNTEKHVFSYMYDGLLINKNIDLKLLNKYIKKKFEFDNFIFVEKPIISNKSLFNIGEDFDEDETLKEFNNIHNKCLIINEFEDYEHIYKNSTYYWMDFINDLYNNDFPDYKSLQKVFIENIKKVLFLIHDAPKEQFYIKINKNQIIRAIKGIKEPKGITYYEDGKQYMLSVQLLISLNYKYIPKYDTLDTFPNGILDEYITKPRDFNLWTGFKAKYLKNYKGDYSEISKILNHIKVVWCDNNDERYHYIISWFRKILIKPEDKTKICLVLQSNKQQIGKGIIINGFMGPNIMGLLYKDCNGFDEANNSFNPDFINKVLINIDEISSLAGNNYHAVFDKMKKLITDPTMRIEEKFCNSLTVPNLMNFILTTNHLHTVKIEKGDRRYAVFQCNEQYAGNFEYFNELSNDFTDENGDIFATYCVNYENVVDVRNIVNTELRQQIIEQSKTSIESFYDFFVETFTTESVTEIEDTKQYNYFQKEYSEFIMNGEAQSSRFYKCYCEWCDSVGEKHLSNKALTLHIKNGGGIIKWKRLTKYRLFYW
jgi:hypothetical protein